MNYLWNYRTPEGFSDMLMSSDGERLTGLWFQGSRDVLKFPKEGEKLLLPVFTETIRWLDIYYSGKDPGFLPPLFTEGQSSFRRLVGEKMLQIPYGTLKTYGEIASEIAEERGMKKMSAQAVGGAVGSNPFCLMIPCHRVIGKNGNLTGYGGGMKNKVALLKLEGHDMSRLTVPTRGTAL